MHRIYFILIFVLFLFSCETDKESDVSDYTPYVVVNSIISTDTTFSVKISYSKSRLSDSDNFIPIEDASVYIAVKVDSKGNITQDFFLDHQGDGIYTRGNYPMQGRNYEMVIEVDGEIITAETYVPRRLKAEIGQKTYQIDPETNKQSVSVEVSIEEEDNEEQNYYAYELIPIPLEISNENLLNQGNSVAADDDGDPVVDTDILGTKTGDSNVIDKDDKTISDDLFTPILPPVRSTGLSGATPVLSGSGGIITASFDGNSSIDGEDSGTSGSSSDENEPTTQSSSENQKYKLKVWAVSYDYYNYLLSNQQNPIGNSETTYRGNYSNVKNGSGIFAGYNLWEVEF